MYPRITPISLVLAVLVALSLLAGCTPTATVAPPQHDARIDKLVAGMDACLASQEKAVAQLGVQQQQLDRQRKQMDELAEDFYIMASRRPTAPAPQQVAPPDCPPPQNAPGKLVVGELEQIWLPDLELSLPARIDTGAETASLDARDIELFERNGKRWVRFKILHPKTKEPIELERRLVRRVVIIQSNSAETERRPVVKLDIVLGHVEQTAEFTLSDRSHLDYQALIGRNILQDVMVVDVSKRNIAPYVVEDKAPAGSAK